MMNIKKERHDNELIIYLEGRLNANSAPALEAELADDLKDVQSLVFDLKDLAYISSAGLRIMLLSLKWMKHQGKMKIINVNETVREIFEVTGFLEILDVA